MGSTRPKTVIDYFSLPDEYRVELIEGAFYEVPVQGTMHQDIASYIHVSLGSYVRDRRDYCRIYEGPISVIVARDDYNLVQPDIIALFDSSISNKDEIFGAPEFIAEVVSDKTRERDLSLKVGLYQRAGVREYLAIDIENRLAIRFDFSNNNGIPEVRGLEGELSLGVFDDKIALNLGDIADIIDSYKKGKSA